MVVRTLVAALVLAALPALAAPAAAPGTKAWSDDLATWRAKVDKSLRRDNGWLTLVGRHVLRYGSSSIGSAPGNDVVLDAAIAPPHLGILHVGERHVRLDLAPGIAMTRGGLPFSSAALTTDPGGDRWVSSGRLALQVIRRDDGQAVLRIADNQSPLRASFSGRLWFEPNASLAVPATFTPYPKGTKITIVNVLNEISQEDAAGSIAFTVNGVRHSLDAVDDDGNLFIIFRDATSADATYPPGRFLYIEKPKDGRWSVDFNRAYNPPCAFSAYTSCPLPPKQNVLAPRIDAGEKYRAHKGG
ncbi:MAG TPA: DUF1684 domain-containing protein [Casimicrobiaceae bacterium]